MRLDLFDAFVATCNDTERRAIRAALQAGAVGLVHADRHQPSGALAYDAGPALALAARLATTTTNLADVGNDPGQTADLYVSVSDASRRLGISARTVREWARSRRVPGEMVGRTWRVQMAAVEAIHRKGAS